MHKRAVFLDRDGTLIETQVLNSKPIAINEFGKISLKKDAYEACKILKKANFMLIMITNQPDVAKGIVSRAQVDEINMHLKNILNLDGVYTCFHDNFSKCTCRKPKPGLIHFATNEHNLNLQESFMVGDRASDIEAGLSAGCKNSFLIENNYLETLPSGNFTIVGSLIDICDLII